MTTVEYTLIVRSEFQNRFQLAGTEFQTQTNLFFIKF
jgi:hypothetical protein